MIVRLFTDPHPGRLESEVNHFLTRDIESDEAQRAIVTHTCTHIEDNRVLHSILVVLK